MPQEITAQHQQNIRTEGSYHSHTSSLYDSQLLLHHHSASAHAHQPLNFPHEVPLGLNAGANPVAHHHYIQSSSPHHYHQGGHHNMHHSHYDPEDYSPGKYSYVVYFFLPYSYVYIFYQDNVSKQIPTLN